MITDEGLSRIAKVGVGLARLPFWVFVVMLFFLLVLKLGPGSPWRPDIDFEAAVASWPDSGTWTTSIVWLFGPSSIGVTTGSAWVLLHLGLLVSLFVVLALTARKRIGQPGAQLFLLILGASSVPVAYVTSLGWYDQWFLTGALLAAVTGRRWWVFGSILMATANSEMAMVAACAGLLSAAGLRDRETGIRSLVTLVMSAAVSISILFVVRNNEGAEGLSRVSALTRYARESLVENVSWFPILLGSAYLGAWLVVVWIVASSSRTRDRVLLLLGLVGLPLAATLVTLDGSRVLVATTSFPFVLALVCLLSRLRARLKDASIQTGLGLVLALASCTVVLVPSVQVWVYDPAHGFRAPWTPFIYWMSILM